MTRLRILNLGTMSGTCLDRAKAFRRLGHEVRHVDLRALLPSTHWVDRVTWRIGGELFAPWLLYRLAGLLGAETFDFCHVDNGEWVSPGVVARLRERSHKIINYNIDDPFGPRDRQRFSAYRKALRHYDMVAVVREQNVEEARSLGARRVLRVWRSADEVSHAPRSLTPADRVAWDCDVLFLGTWMPERGPFLLDLVRLGVPLTLRGANWHKAPEWHTLRSFWKGGAIEGDDYAKAIQCARINLGLLSKGNRDLHTTRSLEIPALGGLLCAERTIEHLAMYREGQEAVFWADAAECANQYAALLSNNASRESIASHGHARFALNRHGNEDMLSAMLRYARIDGVRI